MRVKQVTKTWWGWALAVVVIIAAGVSFTKWLHRHQADAAADACIKNLRGLGLAGMMYAVNNGDVFPTNFESLIPDLRPEFLICPGAGGKKPFTWSQVDFSRITYEMVGAGMNRVTDYSNVFVRCPIHRFKCYGDGWAPPRYCKGQGY